MLRVFVALGMSYPKQKGVVEEVKNVSKILAKYNCTFVQGGCSRGLMGECLREFQKYSDDVIAIVPEAYKRDLDDVVSKESYIVESEADRLKFTVKNCDVIIVFPGGSGTLTELAFYNETRKSNEHSARIVMLNTRGFYDKLLKFVKFQIKSGLLNKDGFKYDVIKHSSQFEKILQEEIAKKQQKLQQEEMNKAKATNKTTTKKSTKSSTAKKSTASKTKSTATKSVKSKSNTSSKSRQPVGRPAKKAENKK